MTAGVIVAVVAFALMEPLTAAVHRFVMHGFGWVLHRSHHRSRGEARWEANDLYPVAFAGITMVAMAAGFQIRGAHLLVPGAVGVTAYGACYGFVHEVYIHRRVSFPWRVEVLDRLAAAHQIHHRRGAAPYGMLAPVVGPVRARDAVTASRPPASATSAR